MGSAIARHQGPTIMAVRRRSQIYIMHLVSFGWWLATFAAARWILAPLMPVLNRWMFDALSTMFLFWWAASVVRRWWIHAPDDDQAENWHDFMQRLYVFGNVVLVGSYWLSMPLASEAMKLAYALLCLGPIILRVIGTLRTPVRGTPTMTSIFSLFAVPLGLAGFYLVWWSPFSIMILIYMPLLCGLLFMMRKMVQEVLESQHAAVVKVAAERDARVRFLASASHDLDQPLQAARLSFEQAARAPEGERRERAIKRVRLALDSAEHLVTGISEHLRLETGHISAKREPMVVDLVFSNILELAEPAAKAAQIELRAVPSRLRVIADSHLLNRALSNLVTNAIRHSGGRRILIGARRGQSKVQLCVIDDGVGIPEGQRDEMFADYTQGDHGDKVRGGFGIGLASARAMAELMGGTLELDGRWVNGCAFRLELPRA